MAISKFETTEQTTETPADDDTKVITTPGGKQIEVNEDGTYADGSTRTEEFLTIKLLKESLAVFESEGYDENTEIMGSYAPSFIQGFAPIPLRITEVMTAQRTRDDKHVVVLGVEPA